MKTVKITLADRADVLRTTWALIRKTGASFGESLKRAWAAIKLKVQMRIERVSFRYVKDDGTERTATAFNQLAPPRPASDKPAKPANPLVIGYFDTDVNDWRSFRADRLIIS